MTPHVTAVRMTGARNRAELPLLVLGPSLGTSATTRWAPCAALLADSFDLLAWDLPGHGHNRAVPEDPFTVSELAAAVLRVVGDVLAERGETGGRFLYAGGSVGGAVGLQLLLDHPHRVEAVALLKDGAPGDDVPPERSSEQVDPRGHALARSALAAFDVGAPDAEPDRVVRVGHSETPDQLAALLRRHFLGEEDADEQADIRELGAFLAEHAPGGAWTRPALDPRSRSLVTLAAAAAADDHEDLAAHVRTARAHGVTAEELTELIAQTAVHCGVPTAGRALRIVRQTLGSEDAPVQAP